MKKLKWILFLLLITNVFSQSKKYAFARIEYDVFYNTEIPNTKKGILEINLNDNNAVFLLSKSSLKSGITNENNEIKLIGKTGDRYMKTASDKKVIRYTENVKDETYLINDTIPEFKWEINHSERKKIGEILCNKATLTFRGRNYIAWYDMNTPLSFGPWKFNNLPGLILEIYDETNRYNWKATAVVYSDKSEIMLPIENKIKAISVQEYIELMYQQSESTLSSQMPRGFETKIINVGRTGIETKFEWE
jgi:GLPGLI family protein